jgi:periplasmic protein TonB
MAPYKLGGADLRRRYPLYVELGLAASLGLLILAFRMDFRPASESVYIDTPKEFISTDEIARTRQDLKPPVPPRPPVPVEVPNDRVLEDAELDLGTGLNLNEVLPLPTPPVRPPERDSEPDVEPEIFLVVEEMPELIGGYAALIRALRYPEIALKAGIEGRVFLRFIVDENGDVLDPVVTRGIGGGCDEEAVRVVSSMKWKPGRQRGRAVPVHYSLSVHFQLNKVRQ